MLDQHNARILARLKEIAQSNQSPSNEYHWNKQVAAPPVTAEEMAQAEELLGFAMPPLLKDIYLEIGNGGFGPGYGLYPLYNPDSAYDSIIMTYLEMGKMPQEYLDQEWSGEGIRPSYWPKNVLMISDWGCNMYSCIDCTHRELPVYRMDSNVNIMVEWALESPSFPSWLEDWMDGKKLFPVDWDTALKVPVSCLGEREIS